MGGIAISGTSIFGQSREDEETLYLTSRERGFTSADTLDTTTGISFDSSDQQSANVSAPPRYAAYMNDATIGVATDRIFLSYHSNAGSGTSRGTLGLYNGNNDITTKTPHQQEWAQMIGRTV